MILFFFKLSLIRLSLSCYCSSFWRLFRWIVFNLCSISILFSKIMVYFDSNIVVRNFTYRSLWIFYLFLAISIKIRSLVIKLGTSKFALLIGMHYFFSTISCRRPRSRIIFILKVLLLMCWVIVLVINNLLVLGRLLMLECLPFRLIMPDRRPAPLGKVPSQHLPHFRIIKMMSILVMYDLLPWNHPIINLSDLSKRW